jgi:L-histidine Nalpha-methyltransferase
MLAQALETQASREFASDVRHYLSKTPQRELHSKYLYDAVGTALFEVITLLPEYGLTRADERVLRANAAAIVKRLPSPCIVAELGSGSGRKTRWILEALTRRGYVLYYPIDVSASALHACRNELGTIDSVHIVEIEGAYIEGLKAVTARRTDGEALLLLFLGSTIGNFEQSGALAFLREIRRLIKPGDALLLAADLQKPVNHLLLAYDDPLGVTAAFNLNLLSRINRELQANFNVSFFRHVARWNENEKRIEMHLEAQVAHDVKIPEAECVVSFERFETIWTESCHKYTNAEISGMATDSGFVCERQWTDQEWPFSHSLLKAV